MYQALLGDASFPDLLLKIDEMLAEARRQAGCQCGGVVHQANYSRKPRGGPWKLGPEHNLRHSFCCAKDGCRKRATPQSVRFLRGNVYLTAVVILAAVLWEGPNRWRTARLQKLLGARRRTLVRWRKWWQERLPLTRLWRAARGSWVVAPENEELPRSLLERFDGSPAERILRALLFLLPLSTNHQN